MTFLEFLWQTLVHICILNLFWSYCPCRQANWETRKLCSFMSSTFLETDGSEAFAPHCIHTQALQPSVGNTSILLKTFPVGISPDFSVPDTLLQSDFLASDRLFLLRILCSNFLFSWTQYQTSLRKRDNPHSVYVTAHCTWNGRLTHYLVCVKLFHEYEQLKIDHIYDLNFWPSLAPRSFNRNMYTEFNSIKVGTIPLLQVVFL